MLEKITKLKERLQLRELQVKKLKLKIRYYQDICPHPNKTSYKSGDYSGDTFIVTDCPTCGFHSER